MTTAFRCSVASLARDEPVFATASGVHRWLLVEQEAPWGPSSFPESALGPVQRRAVQQQAATLGARPLLVRRTSNGLPGNAPARRVWFVDSRPGRERSLTRLVEDDAELAALPLETGWERSDDPLYLVCAHGRHDTCCAVEGRPLAQALAVVAPEQTWKCSHVGGDRFAPNVVVLPTGLYYSRVPVEAAADLVAATLAGRVVPGWLRGRAGLTLAAQAAQHHARAALGRYAIGDLLPLREEDLGGGRMRVVLAAAGTAEAGTESAAEVTAIVQRRASAQAYPLTCHAAAPHRVPTFDLVSLSA